MLLSIFIRTASAAAIAVLTAAATLQWSTAEDVKASAVIVAWGLVGAVSAGLIAVAWSAAGSPAVTPLGKAIRQGLQTLVALPIAGIIVDSQANLASFGDLVVPSLVMVALSFLASLLGNLNPAPAVPLSATTTTTGTDVMVGSPQP